jgi:hypothetical protein
MTGTTGDVSAARTRVLWQEAGSVVRRKARLDVRLDDETLTASRRGGEVVLRVPVAAISEVESVRALKMRAAYHRPVRSRVLRIEVPRPEGVLVIGIVLRDPEPWRAKIAAFCGAGESQGDPT